MYNLKPVLTFKCMGIFRTRILYRLYFNIICVSKFFYYECMYYHYYISLNCNNKEPNDLHIFFFNRGQKFKVYLSIAFFDLALSFSILKNTSGLSIIWYLFLKTISIHSVYLLFSFYSFDVLILFLIDYTV